MADITQLLNKILEAVYGKDVRQSIHDGLVAVNNQVEEYGNAEEGRKSAETKRVTEENNRVKEYATVMQNANDMISKLNETYKKLNFSTIYPVGSIYMSTSNANPGTLFGGTWIRWGEGRVVVGVSDSEEEFKDVEKIGGEKQHILSTSELPQHTHYLSNHTHRFSGTTVETSISGKIEGIVSKATDYLKTSGVFNRSGTATNPASATTKEGYDTITVDATHSHEFSGMTDGNTGYTGSVGNGQAHNNIQPYITCYMWKRTA
jgi:microcystin-dependent protein